MLEKFRKDKDEATDADEIVEIIEDARTEDLGSLEEEAGPAGRAFIAAVDKAVHLQSGAIRAYVHWLRRQHPEQSPAEIQHTMDKHFKNAVSATGAGVGAAAAVRSHRRCCSCRWRICCVPRPRRVLHARLDVRARRRY